MQGTRYPTTTVTECKEGQIFTITPARAKNPPFPWSIYLENREEIYEGRAETDDEAGERRRREKMRRRIACDDNGQCPVVYGGVSLLRWK